MATHGGGRPGPLDPPPFFDEHEDDLDMTVVLAGMQNVPLPDDLHCDVNDVALFGPGSPLLRQGQGKRRASTDLLISPKRARLAKHPDIDLLALPPSATGASKAECFYAKPVKKRLPIRRPRTAGGKEEPEGQPDFSKWTPQDDQRLREAVEAGASLEAIARRVISFSQRLALFEIRERWRAMLYDPLVAQEAAQRMLASGGSPSPSEDDLAGRADPAATGLKAERQANPRSVRALYYDLKHELLQSRPTAQAEEHPQRQAQEAWVTVPAASHDLAGAAPGGFQQEAHVWLPPEGEGVEYHMLPAAVEGAELIPLDLAAAVASVHERVGVEAEHDNGDHQEQLFTQMFSVFVDPLSDPGNLLSPPGGPKGTLELLEGHLEQGYEGEPRAEETGNASEGGGEQQKEEGGTEVPGGSTALPGGTAGPPGSDAGPPGSDATLPGGGESPPGGAANTPGESASLPEADAKLTGGSARVPGVNASLPSGSLGVPDCSTGVPGGGADAPGGGADLPGGDGDLPGGSTILPSLAGASINQERPAGAAVQDSTAPPPVLADSSDVTLLPADRHNDSTQAPAAISESSRLPDGASFCPPGSVSLTSDTSAPAGTKEQVIPVIAATEEGSGPVTQVLAGKREGSIPASGVTSVPPGKSADCADVITAPSNILQDRNSDADVTPVPAGRADVMGSTGGILQGSSVSIEASQVPAGAAPDSIPLVEVTPPPAGPVADVTASPAGTTHSQRPLPDVGHLPPGTSQETAPVADVSPVPAGTGLAQPADVAVLPAGIPPPQAGHSAGTSVPQGGPATVTPPAGTAREPLEGPSLERPTLELPLQKQKAQVTALVPPEGGVSSEPPPGAAEPGNGDKEGKQEELGSDGDSVRFSDVEEMILDMDLTPGADPADFVKQRMGGPLQGPRKRSVLRLEQAAAAATTRGLTAQGGLALLYGKNLRYLVRKTEITLGRQTFDNSVDVDIGREGQANKVSRQQATIKLKRDGDWYLRNMGRRSMTVNNKPVETGQRWRLENQCLVEVGGIRLIFEINKKLVAKTIASLPPEHLVTNGGRGRPRSRTR